MDVKVERTFVIPPSSEPEEVPFTVFDLVAKPSHMTVLYAFSAPNPSNEALLAALAAVLPRFPLLSARIDRDPVTGRPFFVTGRGAGGGAGVLVAEATVAGAALADHLPLLPSPELARLHVPLADGARHMLKVQVNRFAACGGVVVAPSAHHQAADGPSMRTFLQAWADAVRAGAGPGAPPPPPYGPRNLMPRCPPRCEFEHRGAEFLLTLPPSPASSEDKEDSSSSGSDDDHHQLTQQNAPSSDVELRVDPSEITNVLLHYTKEFIAELKSRTQGGNKYTTFETLSAHVWKKITAARGLQLSATPTCIYVAVNGRWRVPDSDAIPRDFFGNAILAASAETTAKNLVGGGLADAAAMVRAAARAVDERYLRSFIDFGAVQAGESLEPAVPDEDNLLSPDVDVNSWLHLGLHTLDFGRGGKLVGILPAKIQLEGEVYLMPSLQKEGGVDVLVALWERHAKRLQSIAYTMD